MKKYIYWCAFLLCTLLFTVCLGMMAYRYEVRQSAGEVMADMREQVSSETVSENNKKSGEDVSLPGDLSKAESAADSTPDAALKPVDVIKERGITIPEKSIDWDALRKQNADIYTWIYVPGTQIDYPILQHPDEKSYYLNHNIDGSEGYPGCIYTQNVNTKDWTDPNTVIYGHNMNDGSMFHDLYKFEDAVFFDETQYLFIYTSDKTYVYEVFAAYPFSNVDLMMCFDYSTPEALLVYFDGIWTNRSMTSHFRETTVLYGDSRIITMSTCIGGQPEKRYLVQAVLLGSE